MDDCAHCGVGLNPGEGSECPNCNRRACESCDPARVTAYNKAAMLELILGYRDERGDEAMVEMLTKVGEKIGVPFPVGELRWEKPPPIPDQVVTDLCSDLPEN